MMKKAVTMSSIAKELNVSTVTVSKALGDKEGVSDELREKIKIKAAQMGYRISGTKSQKEEFSYNIGIVIAKHFISNPSAFYWIIYRYVIELLQKYSYYGILEVITSYNEENVILPNSVTDKKVDGVIVLGQLSDKYAASIIATEIPTVFLDFYSNREDTDTVLSDNFYGSYMLTSYLISCGHRNIGFLGNITSTSSIQDRYLGFYKALLENGIPLRQQWIVNDRSDEQGIFQSFNLPEVLPTAFVCNCDESAYHFINYLKSLDYRVPEDISIVGYDNHIYSTISNPAITTVDVNSRTMSAEAVNIIIKKIRDKGFRSGRTLVTGKITKRDSVKRLG